MRRCFSSVVGNATTKQVNGHEREYEKVKEFKKES